MFARNLEISTKRDSPHRLSQMDSLPAAVTSPIAHFCGCFPDYVPELERLRPGPISSIRKGRYALRLQRV